MSCYLDATLRTGGSKEKEKGPPYSQTKIYATRMSRDTSSCRSISAARVRPQQQTRRPPLLSIDGTDRRTDTRPLFMTLRSTA